MNRAEQAPPLCVWLPHPTSGPLTILDVAAKLGKGYDATRFLLKRMASAGLLHYQQGRYRVGG